ncbi:unnamed protein product [Ilex paraguariensis]|uniref:Uncharacterized protein n=1 Tax=Ilex paraguariensis TaxID=185542 RepID=A0ABC8TTP7_9AQUA
MSLMFFFSLMFFLFVLMAKHLISLIGLLLREMKEFWRVALLLSMWLYPPSIDCVANSSEEHFRLDSRKEMFEMVENAIIKLGRVVSAAPLNRDIEIQSQLGLGYMRVTVYVNATNIHLIWMAGLEKIWEVKPLVNGKDIMSVLQLRTGGPLVREWQQKLLEWQLAHPSGTAEECIDWMRQTHSKRTRTE